MSFVRKFLPFSHIAVKDLAKIAGRIAALRRALGYFFLLVSCSAYASIASHMDRFGWSGFTVFSSDTKCELQLFQGCYCLPNLEISNILAHLFSWWKSFKLARNMRQIFWSIYFSWTILCWSNAGPQQLSFLTPQSRLLFQSLLCFLKECSHWFLFISINFLNLYYDFRSRSFSLHRDTTLLVP